MLYKIVIVCFLKEIKCADEPEFLFGFVLMNNENIWKNVSIISDEKC